MYPIVAPQVVYTEIGFDLWSHQSEPFRALHRHNELEIGVTECGLVRAMFGHERVDLPPGRMAVFWAITPHGPVEVTPGTRVHSMFIPLTWVLQWQLPESLLHPLLNGRVVLDEERAEPCSDTALLKHWSALMREKGPETQRIVLLEVEARLRRLARDWPRQAVTAVPVVSSEGVTGHARHFEVMARHLATHYRQPLSVPAVAAAAGLHPVYAMRVFRKYSGMTIQDAITQHRISHAQRLMATTDEKTLAIATQSGFGSVCRFYQAFKKITGQTPKACANSLRGKR